VFYSSLDEAIFQIFGGDRIKDVIEKLGLAEGEFLQHSMISSSISNVQEKIEKEIVMEYKTNSIKEWFERNRVSNR
jgi:preprotein translocase subunit SecA